MERYSGKTVKIVDGTQYLSYETNMADSTTIDLDDVTDVTFSGQEFADVGEFCKHMEILNDAEDSGYDVTVQIDDDTKQPMTIKAGEEFTWDDYPFNWMTITNASGQTIPLRIRIQYFPKDS